MNSSDSILKSVSWRDLCPWLILFRSIAVALRPSIVFLAFLGLLITPLGWYLSEGFLADADRFGGEIAMEQGDNWVRVRTQIVPEAFWQESFQLENFWEGLNPLRVFGKIYRGPVQILNPELNIRQCMYYLAGSIWMILIWSIVGTMICRIAATHLTRDERIGIIESFGFVARRLVSVLSASYIPLVLIFVFAIPLFLVGLMMQVNFFLVLIGIGWFVVILIGLLMSLVLIPLFFGYPLLWPALATEGSDAFESVSRSYSYPTQKPFHYVFYWIVILFVGTIAAFVASVLSERTIEFTRWGTSWGAGTERIGEVDASILASSSGELEASTPSDQEVSESSVSLLGIGAGAIGFWETGIRITAAGFSYGFFLVAMTGMYLLLRKDNDHSELDEVFVEATEESIPLPTLETAPSLPQQLKSDAQSTEENREPADPGADSENSDVSSSLTEAPETTPSESEPAKPLVGEDLDKVDEPKRTAEEESNENSPIVDGVEDDESHRKTDFRPNVAPDESDDEDDDGELRVEDE